MARPLLIAHRENATIEELKQVLVGWVESRRGGIMLGFVPQPSLQKFSIYYDMISRSETQQTRSSARINF